MLTFLVTWQARFWELHRKRSISLCAVRSVFLSLYGEHFDTSHTGVPFYFNEQADASMSRGSQEAPTVVSYERVLH